MAVRPATHAGSWYSSEPESLSSELQLWLEEAEVVHAPACAIIAPHAGYQYSGPCTGCAYKQIEPNLVKRIFVLGPAHYKLLNTCALTTFHKYSTPLFDLQVDLAMNKELESTGEFAFMDEAADQEEHSLEMHLPFIAKIMDKFRNFTIVPVLVGRLTSEQHIAFGEIFSRYLGDPENLFVISSDFCHWGSRFRYTYYDGHSHKPIHEFIQNLDRTGMDAIESLNPDVFYTYMDDFNNTICGRHPIFIFLHAVKEGLKRGDIKHADFKFVKYAQSEQCVAPDDSSVSYASGSLVLKPD